jgi:transcriptional regulator with XRE-family HTH domain
MTLEQAAAATEIKRSSLSRMETGETRPRPLHVRAVLTAYGVEGEQLDALMQLTRDVDRKGYWSAHADAVTAQYLDFVRNESAASEIETYECSVIPGLLQTSRYAETVVRELQPRPLSDDVVTQRVDIRMTRQTDRITGDHPLSRYHAIVDESVLRRPTGGVEVMREQLTHLLKLMRLSHVSLQVVPNELPVHKGMTGAFAILKFPNRFEPDALYVDGPGGEIWAEDEAVENARLVFASLRSDARHRRNYPMTDLSKVQWFKSTRSNGSSTCVEVATNLPGVVAVRDSKNPGPALVVSPDAWRSFLATMKG